MKRAVLFFKFGVVSVCLLMPQQGFTAVDSSPLTNVNAPEQKSVDHATQARIQKSYGKLPLRFEINAGQVDSKVKFFSRGGGHNFFLTPTESVLVLSRPVKEESSSKDKGDQRRDKFRSSKKEKHPGGNGESGSSKKSDRTGNQRQKETAVIRMQVVGANPEPAIAGEEMLQSMSNYFIGSDSSKWRRGVQSYKKIRYEEVYPGIDQVYYGNQRKLEYDFVVKPGADPKAIELKFNGADRLLLDDEGNLILETPLGNVIQQAPVVYQVVEGVRQPVAGSYVIGQENKVTFEVADYDTTQTLVIDPVLLYSTYLGDADEEQAWDITVDAAGNAYITGYSFSSNFPTTDSSTLNGLDDVFVTKLNASGTDLIYSTLLGGNDFDGGSSIVIDDSGNAYLTGFTWSTNFPTKEAIYTSNSGIRDAFITKLDVSGALVYSTYLGGSGYDEGTGIAIDNSGNAYVTGQAFTGFPTTTGAYQTILQGNNDIFVTKLNASGSLAYSTLLAGDDWDWANGIAVDASGNAYVTGYTWSADFPTEGALDPSMDGPNDAFITKLNANGNGLIYSTYLGGSGYDVGRSIAVDNSGNVYITGSTDSTDFPTKEAIDAIQNGVYWDVFVTKLNANGNGLIYSTYLGHDAEDYPHDIAIDASGNAFVTGYTFSAQFPTTDGSTLNGLDAVFITKLKADGSGPEYSSLLGGGGNDNDTGFGIAVDDSGNVYVAGQSKSIDFPTTAGAYNTDHNGGIWDGFVLKINIVDITPPEITLFGSTVTNVVVGTLFAEPGWEASDDVDGDISITGSVQRTGDIPIDTSTAGTTHFIYYNVSDSSENDAIEKMRTVNIVSVDNIPPVITLAGNNPFNVEQGTVYGEPGWEAWDDVNGDISESVQRTGDIPIDTSTAGTSHSIYYDVEDSSENDAPQKTRTVIITPDVTPPVITLLGSQFLYLQVETVYTDEGATAIDLVDGPLSVTDNSLLIDTSIIGMQTITYTATDSNTNTSQVTRQVYVVNLLSETQEILYSGEIAKELREKADELANPVAIYEYVRNNYEYDLYHGSLGGSINTFLGKRGNDVDLASTLIAMLRSQNIPSQYVVGNISLPAADLMNWLNVQNLDVAVGLLRDQGIQGPTSLGPELSIDGSTVTFEHIWVEALISFDNYRGAGSDSDVDCSLQTVPPSCHWVALDPSFKLKTYHNQNIDIYDQVVFDYDRLYNAIRDDDVEYKNKNPLEIYKNQILDYLGPGKTLEDVKDPGVIIRDESGLLPASLPFEVVVGNVRRYSSVGEHDQVATTTSPAGPKKLQKFIRLTMVYDNAGTEVSADAGTILLSDTTVQPLTLSFAKEIVGPNVIGSLVTRLNGEVVATPYSYQNVDGSDFDIEDIAFPFRVEMELDGPPNTNVTEENFIVKTVYEDLLLGGYFYIAAGGYISNWSQVHRAADRLLQANEQYAILNDAQGVPYVDEDKDSVIDATEIPLLDHTEANEALTGGLLQVATHLYYAKFVDSGRELDALNHVIRTIDGYIGMVQSIHEVEYLIDTAFSVQPRGLLIDLKGLFSTVWRTNAPGTFAYSQFYFSTHIASSLEHQVWQELTGFDAVSTVRGLQQVLSQDLDENDQFDAELLNLQGTTVEFPDPISDADYAKLGFVATVPTGLEKNEWDVFNTRPVTWAAAVAGEDKEFVILRKSIAGVPDIRKGVWNYGSDYGYDDILYCYDNLENKVLGWIDKYGASDCCFDLAASCSSVAGDVNLSLVTPQVALDTLESNYTVFWNYYSDFLSFLDQDQGFSITDHAYRDFALPVDYPESQDVHWMRNNLYSAQSFYEYSFPTRLVMGETYRFNVFIETEYSNFGLSHAMSIGTVE